MDEQQHKDMASSFSIQVDGAQGQVIGPGNQVTQHFHRSSEVPLREQNRQHFLTYLSTRYREVLEQSLQGAALLTLGLHASPEAIAHLAPLIFRHLNQSERVLPPGTSLTEVYDQAGGELLILGEPGAGKSTLLVHLAQVLLIRAERDKEYLLPVIFNLSSWAQKRCSLDEWLVEELLVSYQVPRKVGKLWVQDGRILALFDGLDEVAPSARSLCIDAINTYRKDHLVPLVVCSRTTEYFSQKHRLVLQNAVIVQPLTTEQIDNYLETAGSRLVALRTALQNNQVLRELAVSPLMLNILTLTYRDASIDDLSVSGSSEEQQRQVFAKYTLRMLTANEVKRYVSPQRTLEYLNWLARQMRKSSQTIFYLENIQYTWLQDNRMRRTYDRLATRMLSCFVGIFLSLAINLLFFRDFSPFFLFERVVLGGWLGALLSGGNVALLPGEIVEKKSRMDWRWLLQLLGVGILIGFCVGLGEALFYYYASYNSHFDSSTAKLYDLQYALTYGLWTVPCFTACGIALQYFLSKNERVKMPFNKFLPAWTMRWLRILKNTRVGNAILVGLFIGLSYGMSEVLTSVIRGSLNLLSGLAYSLENWLIYGLLGGLLSLLLANRSAQIQPTDRLAWSWKSLRDGFFSKQHANIALQGVLLGGLSRVILYTHKVNDIIEAFGIQSGLAFGLTCWFLLGLLKGVSNETIGDQQRVIPNQGIRQSLINGLIFGLISTIALGLISVLSFVFGGLLGNLPSFVGKPAFREGLSYALEDWWRSGLMDLHLFQTALVLGLLIGLLAALLNGGLAYLRHYILRFLLWRSGFMPWNYVQFLDEASRHILLRKIGGGYVFIHKLFLDYIASLETPPPLSLEVLGQEQTQSLELCGCEYDDDRAGIQFCPRCGKRR